MFMPQRDILGYMQSDEESHVKAKSQFTWTVLSVSGQGNYYEVRVGCVREYADTQTTFSSLEIYCTVLAVTHDIRDVWRRNDVHNSYCRAVRTL